jgi:hypothetical protein
MMRCLAIAGLVKTEDIRIIILMQNLGLICYLVQQEGTAPMVLIGFVVQDCGIKCLLVKGDYTEMLWAWDHEVTVV